MSLAFQFAAIEANISKSKLSLASPSSIGSRGRSFRIFPRFFFPDFSQRLMQQQRGQEFEQQQLLFPHKDKYFVSWPQTPNYKSTSDEKSESHEPAIDGKFLKSRWQKWVDDCW